MKQYVCVNEPDLRMPAGRFCPVVWYGPAIDAFQIGAASYPTHSEHPAKPICSPPCAHIETCHLSFGSPAIPPQFKASVPVSIARQERFANLN
jgi:hypothetical protein